MRLNIAGPQGSGKSELCERLREQSGAPLAGPIEEVGPQDVCIIVADVRDGLTEEVLRHIAVACTGGARHLVLAANKLDLAGWDRAPYDDFASSFKDAAARFGAASAQALPLSALSGDNIAELSAQMPWYEGPALVSYLEARQTDPLSGARPLRLPITSVSRPDPDRRHYSGTIASGTLARGDHVQVAVSGVESAVARIFVGGAERERASAGETAAVELTGHIDVGSGDILADPRHRPQIAEQFAAHVAWLAAEPLLPGREYTLRMGTQSVTASVTTVKHRVDIDTLHRIATKTLNRGDIGVCTIAAAAPLAIDAFPDFPQSGRFVLTERHSDTILATGTIDFALRRGVNIHMQRLAVSKRDRAALKSQSPCIIWFTGLSGAGKSTIANLVEAALASNGNHTYMLDGDNVRHGLNKDLGFTAVDRVENIRRVGEIAKLFVDAGLIVLCSFISPFRAERAAVRELVADTEFIEVFVSAPLDVCEQRDPKGLYAKSRAGGLPNFTGIDSPYEPPEHADLVLDTSSTGAEELADRVMALLASRGIVAGRRPKKP